MQGALLDTVFFYFFFVLEIGGNLFVEENRFAEQSGGELYLFGDLITVHIWKRIVKFVGGNKMFVEKLRPHIVSRANMVGSSGAIVPCFMTEQLIFVANSDDKL